MHVPQGFEDYYPSNVVLMLLKAIYGKHKSSMHFCKELVACMKSMHCERNKADPCIYFKWIANGLTLWLLWIDNCMIWGDKEQETEEKYEFMKRFNCEDIGPLTAYVW